MKYMKPRITPSAKTTTKKVMRANSRRGHKPRATADEWFFVIMLIVLFVYFLSTA